MTPIPIQETKMDIATAKKFYNRHQKKFVIGVLIVTTTGTYMMYRNQKQFNIFLKEHHLFNEFYLLDEA